MNFSSKTSMVSLGLEHKAGIQAQLFRSLVFDYEIL